MLIRLSSSCLYLLHPMVLSILPFTNPVIFFLNQKQFISKYQHSYNMIMFTQAYNKARIICLTRIFHKTLGITGVLYPNSAIFKFSQFILTIIIHHNQHLFFSQIALHPAPEGTQNVVFLPGLGHIFQSYKKFFAIS